MWIVRLALRRPYTFVVMSVLIVVLGILSIVRTPKDIFPDIDIPEAYQVVVECRDEEEQRELFERLRSEGLKCRVLSL